MTTDNFIEEIKDKVIVMIRKEGSTYLGNFSTAILKNGQGIGHYHSIRREMVRSMS